MVSAWPLLVGECSFWMLPCCCIACQGTFTVVAGSLALEECSPNLTDSALYSSPFIELRGLGSPQRTYDFILTLNATFSASQAAFQREVLCNHKGTCLPTPAPSLLVAAPPPLQVALRRRTATCLAHHTAASHPASAAPPPQLLLHGAGVQQGWALPCRERGPGGAGRRSLLAPCASAEPCCCRWLPPALLPPSVLPLLVCARSTRTSAWGMYGGAGLEGLVGVLCSWRCSRLGAAVHPAPPLLLLQLLLQSTRAASPLCCRVLPASSSSRLGPGMRREGALLQAVPSPARG